MLTQCKDRVIAADARIGDDYIEALLRRIGYSRLEDCQLIVPGCDITLEVLVAVDVQIGSYPLML